jgi:hypothetical protein
MATDLKSTDKDVMLTRFWGGTDRGTCVQITTDWQEHVSLTREQARAVALDLLDFADKRESEDRG